MNDVRKSYITWFNLTVYLITIFYANVLQYQRKYESEKCDDVVIKELIQKHGINWKVLPNKFVKPIMMKSSTTIVDGNFRTWQNKIRKKI